MKLWWEAGWDVGRKIMGVLIVYYASGKIISIAEQLWAMRERLA